MKALDRMMLWLERHSSLLIVLAFIYVIVSSAMRPYDSTDDAANEKRSSLYLYVDHATGCHYIKASWFSELTPRMVVSEWGVDYALEHLCGDRGRNFERENGS